MSSILGTDWHRIVTLSARHGHVGQAGLQEVQREPVLRCRFDVPAPVRRRRPRLRVVPDRRRGGGRGGARRPRVRDRAVPRGGRVARPRDHARARDAHARRPRLRPRPARARARASPCRSTPTQAPSTRTTRSRTGTRSPSARSRVRTLHTPGHRPEHCCFLAGDALLTGDSLFVGATARPDLAVEARDGAEGLFHSLHRLLELPDDVRVMPGHVAGSLCGAGMSDERSSTIGHERRFNAGARARHRRGVRRRVGGRHHAAAAEHGAHRRAEPRPVRRARPAARADRSRRPLRARRARRRRATPPATSRAP